MPNLRISMSKLRRLIQLQSSNLNVRAMGRALSMSTGAVSKYVTAIREAGLTGEEALSLSDPELCIPSPARQSLACYGVVNTD